MTVSRLFAAIIAAACAGVGAARAEEGRGQGGMAGIGIETITACAPTVAAPVVRQVIDVESKGNPLAIGVNGARLSLQPQDAADAAIIARSWIQAGYTVDMGLMQVNSANLPKLGYSVEDMFDACKNLRAGSTVLSNFHKLASAQYPDNPQAALQAALSAYNTGSFTAGFANGYVARYFGDYTASGPVQLARMPAPGSGAGEAAVPPPNPFTAATVVFIRHGEKTPMTRETTQPVTSRNEAGDGHSGSGPAPDPGATGIIVGGRRVAPVKE